MTIFIPEWLVWLGGGMIAFPFMVMILFLAWFTYLSIKAIVKRGFF